MKNLKLIFLICFTISFSLSQAAQLKIHVKPYKDIKENEYALYIDRAGNGAGHYNAFDTMYLSKTGHFEVNDIQIGRYIIAVMHPSSDILHYNIYISDKNSVVEMNVELDRITIPEKIDSVKIVGEFNNWKYLENYLEMKYDKKKKYWYLPENEIKKELGNFYFVINGYVKTHSLDLPISPEKGTWADYFNIYRSGSKEIVFDPAKFKRGKPMPKITITGNDEDYSMVYDSLELIIDEVGTHYGNTFDKTETLEDYKIIYNKAERVLNALNEKYNNRFKWLFPEYLYSFYDYSPVNIELYNAQNTPAYDKIRFGNEHLSNIRNKALLIKGLEKDELMITPQLIDRAYFFSRYELSAYDLNEELNIPYGYFENIVNDLKKESSNQELCGRIEFLKANNLSHIQPDKALKLFLNIKERYPKFSYVKKGLIDKEIKALTITSGLEAPNFKISTLEGKEIELSSLRGKYVFLDFWGSWCGPCREEVPYIQKMFETISPDELVIIGMVCHDTEEKIKKCIVSNGLTYYNAMTNDEIMSEYGVNSFPTTFLIDKEGKIKSKGLRGNNLTDMVKELMK